MAVRRVWTTPVLSAALVLLTAPGLWAANAGDGEGDRLRLEAEACERRGEWDRAGEIYLKLLAADRQSAALRSKLLLCSRHIQLTSRHRDRLYLDRVRELTLSQALNAYLDALGKLQANYVDRDRIGQAALYRAGVEEFGFALADAAFRREHLSAADPEAVRRFAARLRAEWADAAPRQPAQGRQLVREIALAAQSALGLKPSVVVMEFVCGACNALDDQTAYLPPSEETAALIAQLTAYGVRLTGGADGRPLTVEQVMPESWAASVGLKAGERVVHLGRGDGDMEDSSLLTDIKVQGPRDPALRTVKLPTALATVVMDPDLTMDGVGYVRLGGFLKNTPHELDEALLRMKSSGMRALILDLRGNPGGLFAAAVQIAERFIPEGIIVSTQGQAGPFNRTYTSHSGMAALDVPLFVLVDGDTASAAELLAAALKESRRAVLIGQPTYGKGTLQQVLQLAAGGGVRITLARFFAPGGQAVNGVGVTPQFVLPDTRAARAEAQSQARQLLMMRP